jgi:hypothetical protein
MRGLATFSEVPWIMPLLTSLPAGKAQEVCRLAGHDLPTLERAVQDMYAFSMEKTEQRLQKGQSRHDLFSYLIQENGQLHKNVNIYELDADGTQHQSCLFWSS